MAGIVFPVKVLEAQMGGLPPVQDNIRVGCHHPCRETKRWAATTNANKPPAQDKLRAGCHHQCRKEVNPKESNSIETAEARIP